MRSGCMGTSGSFNNRSSSSSLRRYSAVDMLTSQIATGVSSHAKMAALRPDREYALTDGFRYRLSDHSDDRTAGARAADPAAGWLGLRKRSSPPDAASGSATPNNSNRDAKLTATTGRASGPVMN